MQSIRDVRSGALDASKARAVNDIAQTLVNSAKVEIDFYRVSKRHNSQFLGATAAVPEPETTEGSQGSVKQLPPGSPWQGLTHRTRDDD